MSSSCTNTYCITQISLSSLLSIFSNLNLRSLANRVFTNNVVALLYCPAAHLLQHSHECPSNTIFILEVLSFASHLLAPYLTIIYPIHNWKLIWNYWFPTTSSSYPTLFCNMIFLPQLKHILLLDYCCFHPFHFHRLGHFLEGVNF